jgi:hypothetical protein
VPAFEVDVAPAQAAQFVAPHPLAGEHAEEEPSDERHAGRLLLVFQHRLHAGEQRSILVRVEVGEGLGLLHLRQPAPRDRVLFQVPGGVDGKSKDATDDLRDLATCRRRLRLRHMRHH